MQNSSQAFSSSRKSWVAVWPDLAKICHFGKKLKYAWLFLDGLLSTWQNLEPTLAILYVIWQIFIVVNGQILSNKSSHLVTLLGRYNRHSTTSTCNASKQAWTDSIKIRAEFKILIWRGEQVSKSTWFEQPKRRLQCDQMTRLCFQQLAIYNNENMTKNIQIVPKWVQRLCPKQNWP